MPSPALSRSVIEELYSEALLLADEARATFDMREMRGPDHDPERIAMSIEGLKTTTRVMHVLAWLLNQRAYFSGELSERQLRSYGALQHDRPADERQMALLRPAVRALVRDTERLHARIARLDAERMALADAEHIAYNAVEQMRGRISAAFAAH